MKNYDATRERLRRLGWKRQDRTAFGIHLEMWRPPRKPFQDVEPAVTYELACQRAGIEPAGPPVTRRDPLTPYRRNKRLQIKHLDTKAIIQTVADKLLETGNWTLIWDLMPLHPEAPEHLWMAKMRNLLAKGLLDGCGCGCRGDFEMTAKGWAFLGRQRVRDDIAPNCSASVGGRVVRDLWWEDGTMCVQFHDTGEVTKFVGARVTWKEQGEVKGNKMTVTFTLSPPPIKFIPITFDIAPPKAE